MFKLSHLWPMETASKLAMSFCYDPRSLRLLPCFQALQDVPGLSCLFHELLIIGGMQIKTTQTSLCQGRRIDIQQTKGEEGIRWLSSKTPAQGLTCSSSDHDGGENSENADSWATALVILISQVWAGLRHLYFIWKPPHILNGSFQSV